jgi:phospholipase C
VIQFIEKRFGVHERNISPWRRAVTGDLTSVFNFANPNDTPVCRAQRAICLRWPNSRAAM